jgi:hypothetical protein
MHSCSLDAKIRMTLGQRLSSLPCFLQPIPTCLPTQAAAKIFDFSSSEAQVVEKTVEVTKPERKKPSKTAAAASKDPKRKRTPTAFFLFMYVCHSSYGQCALNSHQSFAIPS